MRKIIATIVALMTMLALASTAMAAKPDPLPAPSKLRTQTGGSGHAQVYGPDSAYLSTYPGGYALVYTMARSPEGKLLTEVDMGFVAETDSHVSGGAPRLTIPIDTDGDGDWEDFASIDVFACGGTIDEVGSLTADVWVSTANPDCTVSLNYAGTSYANWDAFAAASPTYLIAEAQKSFIIVDWTAAVTLTSIDLN